MEKAERNDLLTELGELQSAAEGNADEIERVFLPLPLHGRALDNRTLVVRGERGAGKTALFNLLARLRDSKRLERVFPNVRIATRWIEGFSEKGSDHPSVQGLDAFGQDADDESLRLFWTVHLLGVVHTARVGGPQPPREVIEVWRGNRHSPGSWLPAARQQLGEVLSWLDGVERALAGREEIVAVTYDHLDRIGLHAPRLLRERFAGTLLSLWQSLTTRYQHLRPKIFLREDLFAASQRAFADASKLEARSIPLLWDQESLYRLLVRQMILRPGLRAWVQEGGNGIPVREDSLLGWMPPDVLPETGRASIAGFVKHLAGELMGAGVKKGYTHRWILNHLQDAHVRVVPRSLLNLISIAAKEAIRRTPRAKGNRLLHPTELEAALAQTSRHRVKELEEEHPVVLRLRNLSGLILMLERDEVEERLAKPQAESDGFGKDGRRVAEELIGLGVLRVRPDGRIDVPDLYRYGFGIKRKGGVRRPA